MTVLCFSSSDVLSGMPENNLRALNEQNEEERNKYCLKVKGVLIDNKSYWLFQRLHGVGKDMVIQK